MSTPADMTEEQRSVLSKIEKLLRLAGGTTNPEEKASAEAKAQDLLLAYNLDASAIGGAEDGRRAEERLRGGFYEYERDLWARVADVNFCLYWTSRDWIERPESDKQHDKVLRMRGKYRTHTRAFRHHLVGRRINVEATKFTMSYIADATERLTREYIAAGLPRSAEDRVVGLGAALRSRRAVSFREGVAADIALRLWDRRQDQIAQEQKRAAEEAARASAAAAAGASSSTAMTISSLRQSEQDANWDALYGEGWSARRRAEQAERARARRAAEEEYTRWAAAHPEEAAAEEKKRRAEEKKRSRRGSGSRGGSTGRDTDWAAYEAGRRLGRSIGLDPQTESSASQRKIGRQR